MFRKKSSQWPAIISILSVTALCCLFCPAFCVQSDLFKIDNAEFSVEKTMTSLNDLIKHSKSTAITPMSNSGGVGRISTSVQR